MLINRITIDVIIKLSEGNVDAFDNIYHHYHQAVFTNISKFIQQPHLAEDILQDVFLSLWENRKKIDSTQDIGGWLFVVSYNKSMAVLKKRVKEKIIFTDTIADLIVKDDIQTNDIKELHLHLLNDAVNALSPRKKKVFELCRLQGKTYAEAAAILGVSIETIKDYLKDSLKLVREFIFSKYSGSTFFVCHTIVALFINASLK